MRRMMLATALAIGSLAAPPDAPGESSEMATLNDLVAQVDNPALRGALVARRDGRMSDVWQVA